MLNEYYYQLYITHVMIVYYINYINDLPESYIISYFSWRRNNDGASTFSSLSNHL